MTAPVEPAGILLALEALLQEKTTVLRAWRNPAPSIGERLAELEPRPLYPADYIPLEPGARQPQTRWDRGLWSISPASSPGSSGGWRRPGCSAPARSRVRGA